MIVESESVIRSFFNKALFGASSELNRCRYFFYLACSCRGTCIPASDKSGVQFTSEDDCSSYLRDESKVIYQSKDGKQTETFDALECLAAMCSHVPNRGEQMIRYYGHYSNVSRGKRKKQEADDTIPIII